MCCCTCNSNTSNDPIQFVVGDGQPNTPVNGTNLYTNIDIKYSKYMINKNGVGYLVEEVDFQRTSSGGFQLLSGALFTTGEVYTLWFYN